MLRRGGIVERDIAFEHATHEYEPATRRVVLVFEIHVRGTGLQAEAAVYTGIEALAGKCQGCAGQCALG